MSDSLNELFDRDPLELSDKDIQQLVVQLREDRTKWQNQAPKTRTRSKSPAEIEQAKASIAARLGLK